MKATQCITQKIPPEGLFTENVLFHGGNYTFMPGIAAKSSDIFKAMGEAIFITKNKLTQRFKNEIYQGVSLLLELGQRIFSMSNLKRYDYVEDIGHAFHFPTAIQDYSISSAELSEICNEKNIDQEIVDYFLTKPGNQYLRSINDDLNPLLYSPLVKVGDRYYFPLISAQAIAINEFIISTAIKHNCENEFLRVYYQTVWNDVVASCNSMKWYLTNINLPENKKGVPIREAVFQFDAFGLAYVIFGYETTISDKYHEEEHYVNNKSENNVQVFNERINEVVKYFSEGEKFKNYKLLVLYVPSEIGRFASMSIEKKKSGDERIWFGAFEFIQLCRSEEWGSLSLLKYARVYREFTEQKSQIMATAPIDAYSVYKSYKESFYVGDNFNANWLTITPGTGANLFREAKQKRDLHGALTYVNANLAYRLVEKSSEFLPIYSTVTESSVLNLLLESYGFPIWIESLQAVKGNRNFIRQFAESILFWLNKLVSRVMPVFEGSFNQPLVIELMLDNFFFENYTLQQLEEVSPDKEFKHHYSNNRLVFYIPGETLKELTGNTNKGEQLVIRELLKSFNRIGGVTLSDEFIEQTINALMPLNNTKMILLIDSQTNLQIDTRWLGVTHFTSDAETGLLLDNLVSIIHYPKPIPEQIIDKQDKISFCNHAVQKLIGFLQDQIAGFQSNELLKSLIDLNESLTFKREHDKIVIPSQILCFGQSKAYVEGLHEKERKLVSTTLSTRCLIEYLAAKPSKGNKKVGMDEIDKLLAIMYEIINWGMVSDSIHYGLDNPEIGLLRSGRIGVTQSFYDHKMKPFSEANILADIDASLENFDSRFDTWERKPGSEESNEYQERIDEAFKKDWKISFSHLNGIMRFASFFAMQKNDSVGCVTEKEFKEQLKEWSLIPEDDIKVGLELLTIRERDEYFVAPPGFKNEDVFPWKYNREFSFLRRPLIETKNEHGEKMLLWGIRNAEAADRQLHQLFLNGRLKYRDPSINKLLGDRNERRGKNYRQEVFEWFRSLKNFKVWEYEVNPPYGHLNNEEDLGDIDLLIFDSEKNTVYNIECKRTTQAKNIHEMKTELDRYLGRTGQKKYVEKHIQRHKWLVENRVALSKFIGSEKNCKVISFLLASDVIPITYLAADELPLPIIAYPDLKRNGTSSLETIKNKQGN